MHIIPNFCIVRILLLQYIFYPLISLVVNDGSKQKKHKKPFHLLSKSGQYKRIKLEMTCPKDDVFIPLPLLHDDSSFSTNIESINSPELVNSINPEDEVPASDTEELGQQDDDSPESLMFDCTPCDEELQETENADSETLSISVQNKLELAISKWIKQNPSVSISVSNSLMKNLNEETTCHLLNGSNFICRRIFRQIASDSVQSIV